MPLWIVSSAGSGSVIHWNQPPSSSRFTRKPLALSLSKVGCLHLHDDRRVRHAELLGQDDADLAEALIVGLQAGQDQIELLVAHRGGEGVGDHERVGGPEGVRLDVDRASAPRASASRSTCATRAGPAEHTTTSPPCFSLSRSASSSA